MLPQINAHVCKVERTQAVAGVTGGYSEDYDRPATVGDAITGDDVWTGFARAYYMESREREGFGGSGNNMLLRRSMIVESDDPSIDFEEGDIVSFNFRGTERTAKVQAVEERELVGIGGTTRLSFEIS